MNLRSQSFPATYAQAGVRKPRKTIDAKSALADLRAGMSYSALMEKYDLSAVGLESLLRKLGALGVIRYISTKDIIKDLNRCIPHCQLMDKYKLSEEALGKILKQLDRVAFFNETADPRVKPSEGIISGKEIIHDIRSGMTRWELMLKYGLSGEQLKKAFKIILEEQRRLVAEIAEDVRSGVTGLELTQKYQLSNSGLQKVFQKLLKYGLLGATDIQRLKLPLDIGAAIHSERRQIPRRSPSLRVMACDKTNHDTRGTVKDITERGLAVRGIEADIGERKNLLILGDDFGLLDPFELEAECRWTEIDGSEGLWVAGFEVVIISDENLQKLQELIEFVDFKYDVTL